MALQDARCKVQEAACILYLVSVAVIIVALFRNNDREN